MAYTQDVAFLRRRVPPPNHFRCLAMARLESQGLKAMTRTTFCCVLVVATTISFMEVSAAGRNPVAAPAEPLRLEVAREAEGKALVPFTAPQAETSAVLPPDHPRLEHYKKLGLLSRAPHRSWGPEQATGPPDTKGSGDISTAWASQTQDDQDEWLELSYDRAIKPVEVHVVETYNPGALVKVTAATESGMTAVLWKGEDPTPRDAARGTSVVKVTAAIKANRIRIHLASKDVPGWNEIDAVGIKDGEGKIHWAVRARASSTYTSAPEPGWIVDTQKALQLIDELKSEVERLKRK